MDRKVSLILPARNEARSLDILLPAILAIKDINEVIVVNDASQDDTVDVCKKYAVKIINHPYQKGNGAAIKSGACAATGDIFVFMDADGQHQAQDIPKLLQKIHQGFDMVIAARSAKAHANLGRLCFNVVYNWFASLVVGEKIMDLTSGFRAVKADLFKEFLYLLPNGFSYPTTITIAFFRSAYNISYIPVDVKSRLGKSHIKPIKDGIRFLLILFKISTLYSPMKIFFPLSALLSLTGICYYAYTYITLSRFTNMSALLFSTAIILFMMGLVAEQITFLIYSRKKD